MTSQGNFKGILLIFVFSLGFIFSMPSSKAFTNIKGKNEVNRFGTIFPNSGFMGLIYMIVRSKTYGSVFMIPYYNGPMGKYIEARKGDSSIKN